MKLRIVSLMLLLAVVFSLVGVATPVKAASYGTSFLTAITYMNVGSNLATISVDFYSEGATSVTKQYQVADLPAGAAASLGIGSVFPSTFKGSAIMSSSQPLVATMVQLPQATAVKNRPLSNGSGGGASPVLIPTVLKGGTNSIFSVQNTGGSAASVSVEFIPASSGTAHTEPIASLAPGASKYFDMGVYTAAGTTFNGSVRITSAQPMVASVIEASTTSNAVYAFEGTSETSTTVYMPSAMCKLGGTTTSYFAIQNTADTGTTSVSASFSGTVNNAAFEKVVNLGNLDAGKKVSLSGCGTSTDTIPSNFIGSAVINSTGVNGGAAQPLVAMAKIAGAGAFVAAHLGATNGVSRLAAPYVRYTNKFYSYTSTSQVQRAFIAIQNIGDTEIPANTILVNFVGADGTVKGHYTYDKALAKGAKFSVTPASAGVPEFGYVPDATTGKPKSFGGGAIIEGPTGSKLAAVVRITTNTSAGDVGEDYNAMSAPAQ